MSDTEDGGFDKEAEREKLREKLEGEEESRRATEHMSELLLKGATMTNRHCDRCGDPIFRQDGQEFCPTCGEAVEEIEAGEQAVDASGGPESQQTQQDPAPTETASTGTASPEPEPDERGEAEEAPMAQTEKADTTRTPDRSQPPTDDTRSRSSPSPQSRDSGESRATDRGASSPGVSRGQSAGDLREARASLVRTLEDLSRRAEASDDVRRTRDFLEAAREAAEAIEALDRADR